MITQNSPTTSSPADLPNETAGASPSPRPRFISGQANALARSALYEVGQLGLHEQVEQARVRIELGGVKTWWHRPVSDLPPFHLVEQRDGSRMLLVWRAEAATLQIFSRPAGSTRYEPERILTKHSARSFISIRRWCVSTWTGSWSTPCRTR
jgi:hypothetical protein